MFKVLRTATITLVILLALALPVTAANSLESQLVGNWRAQGLAIPNQSMGITIITTNANATFRAQLGAAGTGTVNGQAGSGSWRIKDNIISFSLIQINNKTVPPALSQPILLKIDTITSDEIQGRNLTTGRSIKLVRISK